MVLLDLLLVLGLWSWVYTTENDNPIFFSGMILALSTLVAYAIFMIFPPIFWIVSSGLFVFAGGLLLTSRVYKNRVQELILASGAVLFLCGSDIVLIFQSHGLFALSVLFLFQSLIWYGAYEIFHRQANVKKRAL